MAEVKILVEGYAREGEEFESATATTVLIKDGAVNIVVDPGMDKPALLLALAKENLSPAAINYVILSHNHLDHSLLAGLFDQAKVLHRDDIHTFDGKILTFNSSVFSKDVTVIKTPGHSADSRTVLVKTKLGTVAICEDVFWWMDDEEQKTDRTSLLKHRDIYATDRDALKKSREKVLAAADYIIPGHGRMFKVSQ